MKKLFTGLLALVMMASLLVTSVFAAPVSNNNLPTYGITAQGSDVTLSKEEFQWLCKRSPKAARMEKYYKKGAIVYAAVPFLFFT